MRSGLAASRPPRPSHPPGACRCPPASPGQRRSARLPGRRDSGRRWTWHPPTRRRAALPPPPSRHRRPRPGRPAGFRGYGRRGSGSAAPPTSAAVVEGIGRTGPLVTGAALILFFAFAALSAGPETDLKVMATALGAGILLDATVVRALMVPALTAVLGPANWWLPRPARRLLRIPAPPASAGPTPAARAAAPARPGE